MPESLQSPPRAQRRRALILEVALILLVIGVLAAFTVVPSIRLRLRHKGRRTLVARWMLIVEEPTARELIRLGDPLKHKASKPDLRLCRIDSESLFATLRDPARGRVLCCAPGMIWYDGADPGLGYESASQCIVRRKPSGAPGCGAATFNLQPQCRTRIDGPFARIDYKGWMSVSYIHRDPRRPRSNHHYDLNSHPCAWSERLTPGDALLMLGPMDKHDELKPWLVMAFQAVSIAEGQAEPVMGFCDPEGWIKGGEACALETVRRMDAWNRRAAGSGASVAASTPVGPVRIVAVGQPQRWPGCWWNAAGNPVAGQPGWLRRSVNTPLAVIVQKPGGMKEGTGYTARIADAQTTFTAGRFFGGSDLGPDMTLLTFSDLDDWKLEALLERGQPLSVTISDATAPWEELGRIREGETRQYAGGRFTIERIENHGSANSAASGWFEFDPAYQIGLAGVDRAGRRSELERMPYAAESGPGRHSWTESINMGKSDIESLAILRRPVKIGRMDGLASTPAIRPDALAGQAP